MTFALTSFAVRSCKVEPCYNALPVAGCDQQSEELSLAQAHLCAFVRPSSSSALSRQHGAAGLMPVAAMAVVRSLFVATSRRALGSALRRPLFPAFLAG